MLVALQLTALSLWLAFAGVAHYGYRNYFILMALAWAGGATLSFLLPRWRWFCFAAIIITLPRFAGIVLAAPAHSMLFPWLSGLSLGLALRLPALRLSATARILQGWDRLTAVLLPRGAPATIEAGGRAAAASGVPAAGRFDTGGPGFALACFGAFLLIGAVRAFFEAYSPYVLTGLPVQDLEMAPGVSANYGFYLSMLLVLNLFGPLLFYFADRLYARAAENSGPGAGDTASDAAPGVGSARIARQLLAGLSFGAAVHLCALALESFGGLRLAAGAGDYWQESGRLPGILTDSGASTLLTPFLIATAVFACYHLTVRWLAIPAAERASPARRFALPAGAAALTAFAILLPLSAWHGRAFFLNVGAVLVLAGLVAYAIYRRDRGAKRSPARRPIVWLVGGLLLLGGGLGALWFLRTSEIPSVALLRFSLNQMSPAFEAGRYIEALRLVAPARAAYWDFGGRLFLESPWIGHGLNSFQVELPRFQSEAPRLLIDNPGSLPLGILSDSGVLGAGVFGVLAIWVGRRFVRQWSTADSVTLWLAALPLAFAPAMLLGYHLVLSEFAAIMIIPFLLADPPARATVRTPAASRVNYVALALVAIWLVGCGLRFASATGGPELWRYSKTGRPQPTLRR